MKTAYILGIIAGIFGILGGLFAVMFGTLFGSMSDASSISTQGWVAIAASIVAIVASAQVKDNPKRSGWLLIGSGLVGLVAISFFYVLPAILLAIAGITALQQKSKSS
jgi:uncharacterized membrane protein YfcA